MTDLPSLQAVELTLGYGRSRQVISQWSHEFRAGEMVAITGVSGRGKSTLLYALGLMLKPQAGQILLKGSVVSPASDSARAALRAEQYGFVFQDAALDPGRTILDNVLEGALYRGESRSDAIPAAKSLLEQFGVSLRASSRPGQVSGGQAQRIALCRALIHSPPFLLADEPTGNLDADSAAVVTKAFRERASNGSTVIIATHDLTLVGNCDRGVEL